VRRAVLIFSLLTISPFASAQSKGEPCAARLIRSKPSALLIVKSETLKHCIAGQTEASVEDASIRVGRFNRLQATISIRNLNSTKTIKNVEWRLDIYDEQRKALHDTLYPAEDKTVKPGESGGVSRSLSIAGGAKNILPSFAVILVQVSKITYQDGSIYKPTVECRANEAFDDAVCTERKEANK
jgi:hypothetical protein